MRLTREEVNWFVIFLQTEVSKAVDRRYKAMRGESLIETQQISDEEIKITIHNPYFKVAFRRLGSDDDIMNELINNTFTRFSYYMSSKYSEITKKERKI